MAAISYSIGIGGTLETVTAGTSAPASGQVELRFDQTSTTVTDAGGTRMPKRGEILALMRILEEYLHRDTNVFQ